MLEGEDRKDSTCSGTSEDLLQMKALVARTSGLEFHRCPNADPLLPAKAAKIRLVVLTEQMGAAGRLAYQFVFPPTLQQVQPA